MWITRDEYRVLLTSAGDAKLLSLAQTELTGAKISLQETREELHESHANVLRLTEQLAQLRSSFEWLTNHVNRLERERAELFARVLNLQLPAMSLERQKEESVSPSQIAGTPGDSYEDSIPALQAVGGLFEDVGDDAAAKMGIKHDDMGNVKWTR